MRRTFVLRFGLGHFHWTVSRNCPSGFISPLLDRYQPPMSQHHGATKPNQNKTHADVSLLGDFGIQVPRSVLYDPNDRPFSQRCLMAEFTIVELEFEFWDIVPRTEPSMLGGREEVGEGVCRSGTPRSTSSYISSDRVMCDCSVYSV